MSKMLSIICVQLKSLAFRVLLESERVEDRHPSLYFQHLVSERTLDGDCSILFVVWMLNDLRDGCRDGLIASFGYPWTSFFWLDCLDSLDALCDILYL